MKTVMLFACLIFMALPAFSQHKKDTTALLIPKWEAGIDLLGVVNENHVPKASIFFRYNFNRQSGHCNALRFRLGADSEQREVRFVDETLLGEYHTYAPYLMAGYEWKQIFRRYRWYLATDLYGSMTYSNQHYLNAINDYKDDRIRNYELGLNGVIGFQFNVNKSLAFSLESALVARYQRQYYRSEAYLEMGGEHRNQFNTFLAPIMTVNLICALQKHRKNEKN